MGTVDSPIETTCTVQCVVKTNLTTSSYFERGRRTPAIR